MSVQQHLTAVGEFTKYGIKILLSLAIAAELLCAKSLDLSPTTDRLLWVRDYPEHIADRYPPKVNQFGN